MREYLIDLNATQAAIRSGYSAKTADRIGPELLGKTCVAEAIQKGMDKRAKKTEITGWHDGALRVRLAAPPVDGAANDALRRWLAKELALPQARVTLIRGASSRRKQLTLETSMNQVDDWLKTFEVLR